MESKNAWKATPLLGRIQVLLAVLFICTVTLNQRINSSILIVLFLSLAIDFKPREFRQNLRPIFIFTSVFLVSLFSLLYSDYPGEGKLVIERQLALFFLPLLYLSAGNRLDKFKMGWLLMAFFVTMAYNSVYLNLTSYLKFKESGMTAADWFVKENMYHAFAAPVNMHATFLSLFIGMAIFAGFYWLFKPNGWLIKAFIGLCIPMLITTLILLSSRVVIISVLFNCLLIYPFFIKKPKSKLSVLILALLMALILFGVMKESTFVKDRFAKKIAEEVRMTSFLKADSTYNPIYGGETRADRWYCAVELIKEKPLLGLGAGSEKAELMNKYKKYNLQNAVVNNYDAHSQYLSFGIKTGITGLLLFILGIVYALYVAVRQKSFLYLSMTLLFAFTSITESVLESNKGIFFYAFFNTVLCSYCLVEQAHLKRQATQHRREG